MQTVDGKDLDGNDPSTGSSGGRDAGLYKARLRQLAERLDHQAILIRNGGHNPQAEAQAGKLTGDAFAIRWALRQIAPETECVNQVFAALQRSAGGSPSF